MREGYFIKKNKERWDSYQEDTDDPDEVAKRFTYLVEDLSYAKTFYPFSNTVKYINGLASGIYLSIFQNKKEKGHRVITFWTVELPMVMYKHRFTLLLSFAFFLASFLIGVLSSGLDQTFVRSILGDGYVDRTEQNIANGHPFDIYDSMPALPMFFMIAWNNIKVAMMTYTSGMILSIGTVYMLFYNGVMVGAFEYLFYSHGYGNDFVLVVFIHGTLELSAIVIAGCAGFVLGNSVLFPKTFTRLQSLRYAAKDSIKIIIGLVPVFIVAAFFESYVTRHTDMPLPVSLLILVSSLSFILWYFVFYPLKLSKKLDVAKAG